MATAVLQPSPSPTMPATPAATVPKPAMMPSRMSAPTLYRMSYEVYERIAEAGILGPKDRVILLDGLLVDQMPIGPTHTSAVARGQIALQTAAPAGWYVRAEQPIVLRGGPAGDSAPQPDLVFAFGNIDRYDLRHPIGSEIGLVVEVATDTDAIKIDRAGLDRYAHASIPIACIVNVPDRSIEVYSDPSGPVADARYQTLATIRPGQSILGEIGNATTGPAAIGPIPVESFFSPA